ncbi:MAG: TolC family protein [Oceanicoccus sp.]
MKLSVFIAIVLLSALFPLQTSWGQSIGDISLNEVLAVSMERSLSRNDSIEQMQYRSSSWLAALPSISLSYLNSDNREGTDEAELSLNLPIKSYSQRRIDKKLQTLVDEYKAISIQQKRVYLSGFIREAIWSYKVAQVQRQSASKKSHLLKQLAQQYQDLFTAKSISEYSLLRVQKEWFDAQLNELEYQQELQRWLQQYHAITGLGSIPDDIVEDAINTSNFSLEQHPQLRLLIMAWSQKQQMMLASGNQSAPWNVALTARNVDSPDFQDDQYGIGVEIPLSFIDMSSESQKGEWQRERQSFDMSRDELRLGLQRRWNMLVNESTTLRKKSELLRHSSELSKRLAQQSKAFRAFREIGEELVLRQLIDAVDAQASLELNKIYIQQNNAMLRQAAGISL